MKPKNYLKKWLEIAYFLIIGAIFLLPRSLSAQEISINVENQKLSSVLELIQEQVPYKFAYNNSIIDVNRLITLDIKGQSLEQTLKTIFENTDVTFQISANQIILSSKTFAQNKPQEIQVRGIITDDSTGEPVPFASIQIKGTSVGTTSDELGNYSIMAPSHGLLIFSSIGYESMEIAINNRAIINQNLSPDVESLENVLVVAYGTEKKRILFRLGYITQI